MAWTTPEDVRARWQPIAEAPTEDTQLVVFIEDAEDVILKTFPSLPLRIAAEEIPISRLKRIVSQVVIRAFKTGGTPMASFSRGTGQYNESGSFSTEGQRYMTLTESEKDALRGRDTGNVFMTSMAPDATTIHDDGWVIVS